MKVIDVLDDKCLVKHSTTVEIVRSGWTLQSGCKAELEDTELATEEVVKVERWPNQNRTRIHLTE